MKTPFGSCLPSLIPAFSVQGDTDANANHSPP
jgi:hypothetical protein